LYATLGLHADATLDEVKKAYRQLAKLYHPDVSSFPDARERFIEITEAYELIVHRIEAEAAMIKKHSSVYEENAQEIINRWLMEEFLMINM
jgi:preprotein translocase subunit Sec63